MMKLADGVDVTLFPSISHVFGRIPAAVTSSYRVIQGVTIFGVCCCAVLTGRRTSVKNAK